MQGLPSHANQCKVDSSGNTVPAEANETQYRNIFAQNLAEAPEDTPNDRINTMMHCPITSDFMVDPVITPDGITYECSAIRAWLRGHSRDPMTRKDLQENQLRPNKLAREVTVAHTDVDPRNAAGFENINNPNVVGYRQRNLRDVLDRFNTNMLNIAESVAEFDNTVKQISLDATNECINGDVVDGTSLSILSTFAAASQQVYNQSAVLSTTSASLAATADGTTVSTSQATPFTTSSSGEGDSGGASEQYTSGDNNTSPNNNTNSGTQSSGHRPNGSDKT